MADQFHYKWYQSSAVLGGYSTAGFRAPASHAMDGDKTRLAISEDSEWQKGLIEVAEKLKKLAQTLEESRDQILDRLDQIQDRMLDGLAQFQQRLRQRFQISSKMAVEEQPPSLEKEELTIEVYGGQDMKKKGVEKKGVQVIDLELEEGKVSDSVGGEFGKQNSNLKNIANLQSNLEGRRSRGGGDFADGFVGGGSGDFAGKYGVDGLSKYAGTLTLPWEPGGAPEFRKEKQGKVSLLGCCSAGGSGGPGSGDGVRGTGGDRGKRELFVLNMHGKGNWEKESRKIPNEGGDIAGGFEGGGSRDVAGIYGGGDWKGSKNSAMGSRGENKERWNWKKDLESPAYLKKVKKLAEEAFNKGNSVNALNAEVIAKVICGSHLSGISIPHFIFKPCAELPGGGPAHLYSSPYSHQNTSILNLVHSNPFYSTHKLPSAHYFKPFYFLLKMDQIFIVEPTFVPDQFHPVLYTTHLLHDSQLSHQLFPLNQPLPTKVDTQPILPNLLHYLRQIQPLNHASTRPYHLHVTAHLEDKVEVWAAGSGKYGGADGMVMGTSGNCKRGWHEHDPGPGRLLKHGGSGIETLIVCFTTSGANWSFLILATVMEKLGVSRKELQHKVIHVKRRSKSNAQISSSMGNQAKLQLREGEDNNKYLASSLNITRQPTFNCTTGPSSKQLQHEVEDSKQGGIPKFQLSSNVGIQWKLHSSEEEDSKRHRKYLARFLKFMLQLTFNSSRVAEDLISVLFRPSLAKEEHDYYPP